jgi:esterase/lipase superfamily enzyme
MATRLYVLSSVLFLLSSITLAFAQEKKCEGVDPTAHQPLKAVSLPPTEVCVIGLSNGFPIPDPSCTPGGINSTVTLDVLRSHTFKKSCLTKTDTPSVSPYDWYKITPPNNNKGRNQTCELDHLVPLELGGTDTLDNIWPQCGPPGVALSQRYFKQKDLVEKYLLRTVKEGKLTLADAQRGIATDWTQYLEDAQLEAERTSERRQANPPPPPAPPIGRYAPNYVDQPRMVNLLIASTRRVQRIPQPTANQLELITDARRDHLTFGAAKVRVPEGHKLGQVERPKVYTIFGYTIYREDEKDKKHFRLKSDRWLSEDEFINTIKEEEATSVIIFIHGFNTGFEDGIFRLAQIVWDTQFTGVPILFSWPSKESALSYTYDRESAEYSVPYFRQLIKLLQEKAEVSAIHIIAHSMGNQIALNALANPGTDVQQKSFGQLLFAAPDVDRDIFKVLEPMIVGFHGVTLYASSADKAMMISRRFSQAPRAGEILPLPDGPVVLPNMDTIDATAVGDDLLGLNHNAFALRSAIDDIGRLIRTGERPPNLRSPQIRGVPTGQDPQYWQYPR